MKRFALVVLTLAVLAMPLTGSAKTVKKYHHEVACPPPVPACPAPCPPPCQPACPQFCIPSPCAIVGGVFKGVGCLISGVGSAIGGICNPCGY